VEGKARTTVQNYGRQIYRAEQIKKSGQKETTNNLLAEGDEQFRLNIFYFPLKDHSNPENYNILFGVAT